MKFSKPKRALLAPSLLLTLTLAPALCAPEAVAAPEPTSARAELLLQLKRAQAIRQMPASERAGALSRLIDEMLLGSALSPWDRTSLWLARAHAAAEPATAASHLQNVLDGVIANETFEVEREAELPEGFPEPGPVGRIVEKRYPAYRMARAEGRAAFWTLFRHIQSNDIAMTAPVEMRVDDEGAEQDMAFLYASTELGEAGRQGRVEVIDVDARTVLSIGVRGRRSDGALARARTILEARLEADGIEVAEDAWRVLGYNSPMVRASRQFWEMQVEIPTPSTPASE